MDRDSEKSRTDGGLRDTFESVDWRAIDRGTDERTRGDYLWIGAVATWILIFISDLLSRELRDVVVDLGPGEIEVGGSVVFLGISFGEAEALGLPLVGEVTQVDWLWLLTLLILVNYGVRPLYNQPRLTQRYWKKFRKNKAAVISGLYLTVILLVGVVGSRIFPELDQDPAIANQPPAWGSVESYVT